MCAVWLYGECHTTSIWPQAIVIVTICGDNVSASSKDLLGIGSAVCYGEIDF